MTVAELNSHGSRETNIFNQLRTFDSVETFEAAKWSQTSDGGLVFAQHHFDLTQFVWRTGGLEDDVWCLGAPSFFSVLMLNSL